MPLSAYWQHFVAEFKSDKVYWYLPKGGTCDTDKFRKKFRVFQQFEGETWSPELQGKYLAALNQAKLSKAKRDALARLLKLDFENLGLCIARETPIQITPAGHAYLKETGRSKILDAQVWRYQMPNPLNAGDESTGISLFPHVVLIELMLASGNRITKREFELFVSRLKTRAGSKICRSRIEAWRDLSQAEKGEVLAALKGPIYKTVTDGSGFVLAFHRCDLLLEDRKDQLSVTQANEKALREALALRTASQVPITFGSESDTAAFYGDPEKLPTESEALDYYIDISDVPKAVAAFKNLPKELRGEKTPEEFQKEQFLEKDLEEHLQDNLDKIEPGLKLKGRQYSTAVGPIDLFAIAANDDLVVIELKKGRAADKVFGQICRYMGWIMSMPANKQATVRGYIVSREVDEKLRYAAKVVEAGVIRLQTFELVGKQGKGNWIRIEAA